MITKKYYKLIRVSHEDSEYLRLKNISNEGGVFKITKKSTPGWTPSLEYSLDGVNWTTYDFTTLPEVAVYAGANIYFRGTNMFNSTYAFNRAQQQAYVFSFNKTCEAHGNICSILNSDPTVFSTITSIGTGCFSNLFNGMSTLTTPPSLGNITTCGNTALYNMFYNCTSLTTVLDCSKLVSISVASLSYTFSHTAITEGADLSNLTTLIDVERLYESCPNIYSVTAPNISNLTSIVLQNWLQGAGGSVPAGTTKVVNVPTGATITDNSTSGIPTGWTRVDY